MDTAAEAHPDLAAAGEGGVVPEAWTRRVWIVDGHNAIFSIPEFAALQEEGKKAQARGRLAAWLQGFASRLNEPLTIVFDGRRECGIPDPELPFLRILFSHPPEEADDRIVMLAQAAVRAGRGVAVVSNDRSSLMPRLPSAAIALGVEEFRQRYIDRPLPRPVNEKSLPARDAAAVERRLLDHHAARAPLLPSQARREEQRARRRWMARFKPEALGPADGPLPSGRVKERARRDDRQRPPSGGAGASGAPAAAGAGQAREEAKETPAREAKRRRGLRKQKRRLEELARRRGPQGKGDRRGGPQKSRVDKDP